ncbi:MAG: hypothetical protein ACI906_000679 [Candidatus Latescibacterota bacterium]|jgi:hypothetical protein
MSFSIPARPVLAGNVDGYPAVEMSALTIPTTSTRSTTHVYKAVGPTV